MDRIEIFSTTALTDLRMMLETKPSMTQEQKDTLYEAIIYLADTKYDFLKIARPVDERYDEE